jgi:hypothetical protein
MFYRVVENLSIAYTPTASDCGPMIVSQPFWSFLSPWLRSLYPMHRIAEYLAVNCLDAAGTVVQQNITVLYAHGSIMRPS